MIPINNINKKFGAEAGLIILLIRVYFRKSDPEEIVIYLQEHPIDWDVFYQRIYEYEIRPLIFIVVSAYPAGINADFLCRLKNDCLYIASINLEKVKELIRLHNLFKTNNILAVPFKGVLLSKFLFGDYSTRETCDIDFLIDSKDSWHVTQVLIAHGYQTRFYYTEKDETYITKISSERSFFKGDITNLQSTLEIHWRILQPSFDVPLTNTNLLKQLDILKKLGLAIPTLTVENMLISLLTHHGVNDVWRTLKHVVDISAFLENHSNKIDWPSFDDKIKQFKIKRASATGFLLAHALLGTTLPLGYTKPMSKRVERILSNMLKYPMLDRFKYSYSHFMQHLSLRDNYFDQLRFIFRCILLLFIPTANDLKAIKISKRWFFTYYFIKPYRLLKDYGKTIMEGLSKTSDRYLKSTTNS